MGDEKNKARRATPFEWMRYVVVPLVVAVLSVGSFSIYLQVVQQTNIINYFFGDDRQENNSSSTSQSSTSSECRVVDFVGVPESSTSEVITVDPNQFHLWSAGPVTVVYQGTEIFTVGDIAGRGNVILLLPVNNQETEYTITNVNIASNWHGIWTDCGDETATAQLEAKAINATQPNTGNCSVSGCSEVHAITIRGNNDVVDSIYSR